MRTVKMISALVMAGSLAMSMTACAAEKTTAKMKPVGITKTLMSVTVTHNGQKVMIQRDPNNNAVVSKDFAKTSRPCPPFCIQPSNLAPGVETIGEVEMLHYLAMKEKDASIMVIDSRTPDWVKKGTIPGSVNIPWKKLNLAKGGDPITVNDLLTRFGARNDGDGLWDFRNAKTLVMFCNGMWCGQSPNNIMNLVRLGYPAHKIKWYRGGMQNWSNLGFTTVK